MHVIYILYSRIWGMHVILYSRILWLSIRAAIREGFGYSPGGSNCVYWPDICIEHTVTCPTSTKAGTNSPQTSLLGIRTYTYTYSYELTMESHHNFKHLLSFLSFVIPGHDPLCPVYCSFHIYKTFATHCKTLCLYSWCWGTPVTKVIVSLSQLQICICVNICIFICVCNCICIFALGGTIT